MTTVYPLQKLCIIPSVSSYDQVLLVASGPLLSAVSLDSGKVLHQWPGYADDEVLQVSEGETQTGNDDSNGNGNGVRPHKKRKVNSQSSSLSARRSSGDSEVSVEIVAERKKGERRRPKKSLDEKLPNISHVLASKDGKKVVVVTTDNKAITVLQVDPSFHFRVLSERCLPKRLCAIRLTTDEQTILAADKFGDVYALPLDVSPDWVAAAPADTPQATFTPSATELTVHTRRNRATLRMQLEQKRVSSRKEGPNFEHKILLGHVSLLTDLQVAEGLVNGRARPFILTADRDEHIRVSRGIPQAHVIETYCLGHHDFITKLCILPWAPEILVAGNGEPSLRTFRWQTGEMLQCLSITNLAQTASIEGQSPEEHGKEKLAVSGIWPIRVGSEIASSSPTQTDNLLLIAFEGLPQLHTFSMDEATQLRHLNSQTLTRNVLDVVHIVGTNKILVSLDIAHEAGSTKTFQTSGTPDQDEGLQMLELQASKKRKPNANLDLDLDLDPNQSTSHEGGGSITNRTEQDKIIQWTKIDDEDDNRKLFSRSSLQECYSPLTIPVPISVANVTATANQNPITTNTEGAAEVTSGTGTTTTTTITTATNQGLNRKREKEKEKTYSGLGEFLYGLENLRKKRGLVSDDHDDDVGGDVDIEVEDGDA